MNPPFERVTIIGVGLLGASLGLALKAGGLAREVVGVGRRQSSLDTALKAGAVDEVSLDPLAAVGDSDMVVLAPPAQCVVGLLRAILPVLSPSAVVTDVASTKKGICAHAAATWPAPRRFVGSHPMAGSEKYGPEHGRADLYAGSVCLVEAGNGLDAEARETVCALWRAVGAEVVDIDPGEHDALLARTSHIPHILSAAIAIEAVRRGEVKRLIGNGFRDTTRIAAGRPEVWRDICLTNAEAVLEGLAEMRQGLEHFSEALRAGDGAAIEAFFEEGNRARRKAVEE